MYKIRKNLNLRPKQDPYRNVAMYHLKRPQLKVTEEGIVDGHPIIFVEIGAAQ